MKTSEVTQAELVGAAKRAGATVEWRARDENGTPRALVMCKDGWMAARYLAELCADDVGRPNLLSTAKAIRDAQLTSGGMWTQEDAAREIHRVVKASIRFEFEEGEIFQSTAYTAQTGVGDCDDHARVVVGLCRAAGLRARLAFLAPPGEGPAHVAAQAFVNGEWAWLETTCDAHFGEHPFTAARRLGILRADIQAKTEVRTMGDMAEVRAMAGVGASPVSDDFLIAGAAMCKRLGISWPDLLKVMNFESGINPNARNPGGALGLIQFDPPPANLPSDAVGQLPFVEAHFREAAKTGLHSVARIYQCIFLPATCASIRSGVLLRRNGTGFGGQEGAFYAANASGFDPEGKGYIRVEDLGRTAETHAARPNSPYQRAFARLRIVAPSSIPVSTAGAIAALGVFSFGVAAVCEHLAPGSVKRPFLRYVYSARKVLGA